MTDVVLLDASAYWRLGSPALDDQRRDDIAERIARGLVAASTPLLLETRAGRQAPAPDPGELPLLWTTQRAQGRAAELQLQLRTQHQHLGLPPLDYLIAAIAEDHGAGLLHYDQDFDRLAAHTDLAVALEPLMPLGSIP